MNHATEGGMVFNGTITPTSQLTITCPSNITVRATSPAGAVVTYIVTTSGGTPPITVVCAPPSGSTFPIGTITVNCTATDALGQHASCSFTVTVLRQLKKHFFQQNLLPPGNGMYVSPAPGVITYSGGTIILSNIAHRIFSQGTLPPPSGGLTHTFNSVIEMELSTDSGLHWASCVVSGVPVQIYITNNGLDSGDNLYGTAVQELDVSGGNLPAGLQIRLRSAPTSSGETRTQQVPGGYMIDSFFDIYTEVSTDSGGTWMPASAPLRMELKADPALIVAAPAPRTVLPMPNGQYISPQQWHQLYANGIVIKDIRDKLFTQWMEPPLFGGSYTHTFDSQLDFQLSTDGGNNFTPARAPATMTVSISNVRGFEGRSTYETEVTQLDISGGDLPAGVQIRESPSKRTEGGTCSLAGGGGGGAGGGAAISSFFDIFTEVSTDSGGTWAAATNGPAHMELQRISPAYTFTNNLLPALTGEYISPQQWHAYYANGIVITNVIHRQFTAAIPPPLPGTTTSHTFGSQLEFDVSYDGGSTFTHATAPATVGVQITARLGDDGTTVYYDTEMQQLDIAGGTLPGVVQIRESPSKASKGRTTSSGVPGGGYKMDSFFDVFTEISTDGGNSFYPSVAGPATATLQPSSPRLPLTITCPSNITVRATSSAGAVVNYTVTTSGGTPPITTNCVPPSGSTFPIGTTTVNCTATDADGQQATCSFNVTVLRLLNKSFFRQSLLPPTNGVFVPPTPVGITFPGGIIVSNISHGVFSAGVLPPPTPGGTLTKSFSSRVEVDISLNSGLTWQSCVVSNVPVAVGIINNGSDSGDILYGTELTQLDISGGTLPAGVQIRESPTKASLGQTRIETTAGGYQIDSFFDVYLEVSTDFGGTYVPANSACTVQVKPDPALIAAAPAPRKVLPMPNGQYISPTAWHQLYANGIVIKDIRHKLFTGWMEPPVFGGSQTHTFDSQLDFQLSTDGGGTFIAARAPATMTVTINNVRGFQGRSTYGTEVTQLDVAGGDLPAGVMIRESPTKASKGGTSSMAGGGGGGAGGGAAISSFFDIFTEVSTDSGGSWNPATNGPAHMELQRIAAVHTYTNNLLPVLTGQYISPQQWHAYYANGIVITNVVHRTFSAAIPPPPPGNTTSHTFTSQVEFDVAYDGGAVYEHATAPATVTVQITARLGDDGTTVYYDTEMQQLDIAGGGLPSNVQIRESPSKASLGRTTSSSVLTGGVGYQTDSFFDVYTEVSTDGGFSWYPTVAGPATVTLQPRSPQTALNITCPTNMTVQATNVGGKVVNYTVLVSGGCPPYTTNCVPPSGSTFPIGTTTVNCTATDVCGGQTNCSFTVTVLPPPALNITCPTNMTVQATNPAGAVVNYTVLVSGGCPPINTNCTPPSGSTFPIGNTVVNCQATDSCGQSTNCSFTITVVPKPLSITCPSNITVRATSPAGAVVNYTVTTSGGCPPITVIGNPPSGSTFPIGVTIVNCTATDACGQQVACTFKVTVLRQLQKRFYVQNLLPPTNGVFVAPTPVPVTFPGGILVSNIAHGSFSTGFQPPLTIGGSLIKSFTSQVQVDVSFNGGLTWQSSVVSNVPVTVGITNNGPDSGDTLYGTELTELNISGGTLPSGVMIRESPTRASTGETRIQPTAGGYQIDSFFDIYLEVSTDFGGSWQPALSACTVEVKPDPALVAVAPLPRPVLPAPNGQYVGPRQAYGNGVIVREIRHKLFNTWDEPPAFGVTQSHTIDSKVDFQLSTDGGVTFTETRAPATITVAIKNVRGFQGRSTYDTEMTQLDVSGGELPAMLQIRESPTKASKGGTSSLAGGGGGGAGGGAAISSFFDVYTEVSTDGGLTYFPATNGPCHMELRRIALAHSYTNNLLPPFLSDYASQQHAKYGTDFVLTNVFHRGFTAHFTPPPLGGSNTHTFSSTVEFDLSQDGGRTYTHASAPATVTVSIMARTESDGVTVYYDTEMTQLHASGGGLPPGIEIRESPTKQSLGRTTSSGGGGGTLGYQIDSFFDVYTELTTGGSSWLPTTSGPAEVTLEPEAVQMTPVTITSIQPLVGPGAQVQITYTGGSGSQFVLLKSTSITAPRSSWARVATNPTTPGTFIIPALGSEDTVFYSIKSE
jgi:fluoride ion exporter CrcB/FEX